MIEMTEREDRAYQALLELPETNGTTTDTEIIQRAGDAFNLEELNLAADYLGSLGYLNIIRTVDGSEFELLEGGREFKKRIGR